MSASFPQRRRAGRRAESWMHATAMALAVSSIAAFPAVPVCEARYRDCRPEQSRESLAGVFRSGSYAPERAEALAREVELEPHR